eukprot:218784-Pleurochrysis_carterae.AAC.1
MPRHELPDAGAHERSAARPHVPAPPQIPWPSLRALYGRPRWLHRLRLGYPTFNLGLRVYVQPGGHILVVKETGDSGALLLRGRDRRR